MSMNDNFSLGKWAKIERNGNAFFNFLSLNSVTSAVAAYVSVFKPSLLDHRNSVATGIRNLSTICFLRSESLI